MNRQQAMEYDNELSEKLQNYAISCGEDAVMGSRIVESFVEFLPENEIKGMIWLGEETISHKLGNVRLDLKKALLAGMELVAAVNKPESLFNYIQLLIVSVLFIKNATMYEFDEMEACIVYLLHTKNVYQFSVGEELFIKQMQEWYREIENKELEKDKIIEAISRLEKIKVVECLDGTICLKEKVWGKMG